MNDSTKQQDVSASSEVRINQSSPIKHKMSIGKKIAIIIGAVILVAIALIMIVNSATSAPLKVSDEFISDIQANKASAAYNLMSADAQAATSSQDFDTIVNQLEPILTGKPNNTSKEVSAATGSDPSAKIVYEIKGSDNLTHEITVNLVQKSDQWKVLNFESVKK